MIPYHGTPVGGSRQDVARFLVGRHALVPFPRQDDMGVVAEVCQSFVLDNGAFSVWKRGITLDVDGYVRWCEEWHRHPGFDWALIPDIIGPEGTEEANDSLVESWPSHIRGVPVWHMHESVDRLRRLCDRFQTVALGSSGQWDKPGAKNWWERMSEVMDGVCDSHGRPPCRFHGLRMLAPKVFTRLPLASADSTNASMNCGALKRFGMYVPPSSAQRAAVIAARIEMHQSAPLWINGERPEIDFIDDELDS